MTQPRSVEYPDDLLKFVDLVTEAEIKLNAAWASHRKNAEAYWSIGIPAPPDDNPTKCLMDLQKAKVKLAEWVVKWVMETAK